MRIPRNDSDPNQTFGYFHAGKILVMLNRGDYWQCAFVIAKGAFDEIKQRGLPEFLTNLAGIAPFLSDRTDSLKGWDDISLLSVAVDRLREWSRPGLLCIGDSAHAMSPVGGVGINLAIQDAVAAANILAQPLLSRSVTDAHLCSVQERREFPIRMTQRLQIFAHHRFIWPALSHKGPVRQLPLLLKLLQNFPVLRRIPARVIGVGFRPEHIHTSDSHRAAPSQQLASES